MKLPEFQHYLQEQHIDFALLIHPDINITYFTQTLPSYAYLIVTPKKAIFYITKLDAVPKLPSITVKNLSKNWMKNVGKVKKIGINKKTLTVSQLEKIKKLWPKAKMVDVAPCIEDLRAQKTVQEAAKIAKACEITSYAFANLMNELPRHRLRTEQQVAHYLDEQFQLQGAEPAFPTIVAMGKNAAIPHHVPNTTSLTKGFMVIDFGAKYQHYCADMTRTIYLGKPSAEERELYEFVRRSQQQAIDTVAAGKSFVELDKVTRKALGKHSSYFIHSLGHGIGLEVHEGPSFFEKGQRITKNHVFTIEPGIYFPKKLGIRIEDTLLFTSQATLLTKFTKDLVVV